MGKIPNFFFLFCIVFSQNSFADECPALLENAEEKKRLGQLRVRAIKGWDKLLTWALSPKEKPYIYQTPIDQKKYSIDNKELKQFDENYGYFSIYHPIFGVTTKSVRDIKVTNCLLEAMDAELKKPQPMNFTSDEILAKVIAYRPLELGMEVSYKGNLYKVDTIINLWKGMPAFGLIPIKRGETPILLYRGTDLNVVQEKGWASILSDLDIDGPGHCTFLRAQKEIHAWLAKVKEECGPAKAMGFSLGGVFVLFTLIYEHRLLSKNEPSIAFNPPGVSKEVLKKWQDLEEEEKIPHITYVNQGDFVSKIGLFLSNVWLITLQQPMNVIEAHLTFISAQPLFRLTAVDVKAENKSRE